MPGYSESEIYYGLPPLMNPSPKGYTPDPYYSASQDIYFDMPYGTHPGHRADLMIPIIADRQLQLQMDGVPDSDPRMQALNTALSIYGARDAPYSRPPSPQGPVTIPQTDAYDHITPVDRVNDWLSTSTSRQRDIINHSGMTMEEAEDIVRRYYTPTSPETAYTTPQPPATVPLTRAERKAQDRTLLELLQYYGDNWPY